MSEKISLDSSEFTYKSLEVINMEYASCVY